MIANLLENRAKISPHDVMISTKNGIDFTFQHVADQSKKVGAYLTSLGIREGDRVSVHLPNSPLAAIVLFALQYRKIIAHCVNTRLTKEEVAYQLEDCQSSLLITSEEEMKNGLSYNVPVLMAETLQNVLVSTIEVGEVVATYDWHDACSIMYTSGTTGKPKGVIQTYSNHYHSASASSQLLTIAAQDRWYCAVPLFHVSGFSILFRSVVTGCGVYLSESFDEEELDELIQTGKVTIASVVTAMLLRYYSRGKKAKVPPTYKGFLVGGGPVPKWLLQEMSARGFKLFQTYGMTETCSQVVTLSPEHVIDKMGSVGLPLLHTEVKIHDRDGAGVGEIWVKGPTVTAGYWGLPDVTNQSFSHGWFQTGDMGYQDKEGFLYLKDRRSDLIISGGENIYPAEIESILLRHSAVAEAAVIGVEDSKWGHTPVACIVLKNIGDDKEERKQELLDYCRQKVAAYKCPSDIRFLSELPKTSSLKIKRFLLKDWVESERK